MTDIASGLIFPRYQQASTPATNNVRQSLRKKCRMDQDVGQPTELMDQDAVPQLSTNHVFNTTEASVDVQSSSTTTPILGRRRLLKTKQSPLSKANAVDPSQQYMSAVRSRPTSQNRLWVRRSTVISAPLRSLTILQHRHRRAPISEI